MQKNFANSGKIADVTMTKVMNKPTGKARDAGIMTRQKDILVTVTSR